MLKTGPPTGPKTGRGVRVAVIDSGVNPSHPHIARIEGGCPENDFLDRLGHGTAVMAAIQEKAPDAEYFAVRLFDRTLRTNIDSLTAAIEWSIAHEMHVINLSLGTSNPAHAEKFAPLIAHAVEANVILVAARGALPGDLPGVIGVRLDATCPRDQFRIEGGELYASGFPRTMPGVPPERNLNGISFAVANMTGFVARACEDLQERSRQTIIAALTELLPAQC